MQQITVSRVELYLERVRAAVEAETLKMTRQQWFRIRKAALGYDVP